MIAVESGSLPAATFADLLRQVRELDMDALRADMAAAAEPGGGGA